MLQSNIADSTNVWVILIGVLGLGVIMPLVLLGVDANVWLLAVVVAIGQFLAFIFTRSTRRVTMVRNSKSIHATYVGFVLFPVLSALGYTRLHSQFPSFSLSALTILTVVGMGLYLYVLGRHFINCRGDLQSPAGVKMTPLRHRHCEGSIT